MNFLAESLKDIAGISIHFSSDCNMACKYCYIEKDKACMAAYNRDIRQSLQDGSFAAIIENKMKDNRDQIEDLSLWGAEPTINSKLFKNFIYELLDYFPNTNSLMFSSNALLGAQLIYEDFFIPLYDYAEDNKRKITFKLQLSLDGPPEFNDDSRHEGATQNTLNTMYLLLDKCPAECQYFTFEISTKPTLDVSYMKKMIEGGVEKFQWYYDFMNDVAEKAIDKCRGKSSINCLIGGPPTLVDPGYHTVEDGKTFAKWVSMLKYVDRSKCKGIRGPLFIQPLLGAENIISSENPLVDSINCFSCSASKNNIAIDHNGVLYTCNRLCRNAAMPQEYQTKHSMQSNTTMGGVPDKKWLKRTWGSFSFHDNIKTRFQFAQAQMVTLAACGQIEEKYMHDEDAQKMLYYMLLGLMCHIGAEEDYTQNPYLMPFSYYRYLGNGAVEELLKYYKLEVLRGNTKPWKIVM